MWHRAVFWFRPPLREAQGMVVEGAVAVVFAVVVAFALQLLTSPAVERAEHRSGTRGEEAHVSERSELCAVPSLREERRAPMRRSRIGSRPAVFDQPFGCWKSASFGYLFFARAKKSLSTAEWLVTVTRSRVAGVEAFDLAFSAVVVSRELKAKAKFKAEQELWLPFQGGELLCLAYKIGTSPAPNAVNIRTSTHFGPSATSGKSPTGT